MKQNKLIYTAGEIHILMRDKGIEYHHKVIDLDNLTKEQSKQFLDADEVKKVIENFKKEIEKVYIKNYAMEINICLDILKRRLGL